MDYQMLVLDLDGTLTKFQKRTYRTDKTGTHRDSGGRKESCTCQRTPDQRYRSSGRKAESFQIRRIYALLQRSQDYPVLYRRDHL